MSNDHITNIRLDEDRDVYVRECTCSGTSPVDHGTYEAAFAAGLTHWTDKVKDS